MMITSLVGEHMESESGKKAYVEILGSKGNNMFKSEYCTKCKKYIRIVEGKFHDGKGSYHKGVCNFCDEIKKIRVLIKEDD